MSTSISTRGATKDPHRSDAFGRLTTDVVERHADVLAHAARGNRDAFMALYDATCADVYAFFLYRLGAPGAAEEATHALYLTAWSQARERAGSGLSALAWLIKLGSERR